MSSLPLRQVFEREVRAWVAAQTLAPGMAFVSTVNEGVEPPLAPWCTLQFVTEFSEALTYCANGARIEHGTADCIVFVPAGSGFALASALADDVELTIARRDLSADGIWLGGTVPAAEYNGGRNTARHYALIASFAFERYY